MNDLVVSIIRTMVPAFVGPFALYLASNGVALDEVAVAGLTAFLISFAVGLYYAGVRLLAMKFPAAEILLGVAKTPVYVETKKGF